MTDDHPRRVNCPSCQRPVAWSEASPHRPFCSARCKLIDFGEWATEKHSIPGEPAYLAEDGDEDELLQ